MVLPAVNKNEGKINLSERVGIRYRASLAAPFLMSNFSSAQSTISAARMYPPNHAPHNFCDGGGGGTHRHVPRSYCDT
jgi:hypothetical protein